MPRTSDPSRVTVIPIASPGHSGQTWLNLILGAHPEILSIGEIGHAGDLGDVSGVCSLCGLECEFWGNFQKARDPAENLLVELARHTGRNMISISGGGRLKRLLRDPRIEVKSIRLLRDGRATTASYHRKYSEKPYEDVVRRWVRSSRRLDRRASELGPDRSWRVRYEDLRQDTERCVREICQFLGIGFEPAMLEYWKRMQHVVGANQGTLSFTRAHFGLNPPGGRLQPVDPQFYSRQQGQPFTDDRWRRELDERKLTTFEWIAGSLNRSYGYPPSELRWRFLRFAPLLLTSRV